MYTLNKHIPLFLVLLFLFTGISCTNRTTHKDHKLKDPTVTADLSDLSIYHLPSLWTTQEGHEIALKDLQGDLVVMAMIYTSCQAACPRLVADMRHIAKSIPQKLQDQVKFVLVSIDPEVDTPERLKAFAIENEMDSDQWLFLRSDAENTQEFAAILAVNYKRISPIDFSHSNIISLFNEKGELVFQQEGLGVDYSTTIEKIITEAKRLSP